MPYRARRPADWKRDKTEIVAGLFSSRPVVKPNEDGAGKGREVITSHCSPETSGQHLRRAQSQVVEMRRFRKDANMKSAGRRRQMSPFVLGRLEKYRGRTRREWHVSDRR